MGKTRVVLGCALIVGIVGLSAAPAGATFKAQTAGATQGVGVSTGVSTFEDEGAKMSCEKFEGAWQIRSTGKISEETKGPGQRPTKTGPHLDISVSKWNGCTAFGFVGATIKPCVLQLEQPNTGKTTATASVVTECTVTAAGNCELKIAPGVANEHLNTITLENEATSLNVGANIEGITSTATSLGGLGCVGVSNLKNKVGKEKATLKGEKLNVV